MNAFNKTCSFLSHTNKLCNAHPNTDCLATSNGVCTKRNTAQFGLLLVKNKVNNNSQTWPLIHLTSLVTFYSKTPLLKWVIPVKEHYKYEYEMKMNKMAWMWNEYEQNGMNVKWIWTKWQILVLSDIHIIPLFYLILTRGPIIIVKKNLKVILSWRMLFKVAFRCMFY